MHTAQNSTLHIFLRRRRVLSDHVGPLFLHGIGSKKVRAWAISNTPAEGPTIQWADMPARVFGQFHWYFVTQLSASSFAKAFSS